MADVARGLVYASETSAASGDRDRLWTLLVTRYAFARKVGWYFHGERCDEVVPPLGARVAACDDLDDETEPT